MIDLLVRENWSEGPMQQLLQSPPVHPGDGTANTDFSVNPQQNQRKSVSSSNTYSGESGNLVGSSGWEVCAED